MTREPFNFGGYANKTVMRICGMNPQLVHDWGPCTWSRMMGVKDKSFVTEVSLREPGISD